MQKVRLFAPKKLEHDGCKMYVFSHTGVWEVRFFAPMVFIWLSALHQALWRNSVTGCCADTVVWHFIRTTFRHWSTVNAATRCVAGNFLCFSQLSQLTSMSHILCSKRVQLWVFGRQELIYKRSRTDFVVQTWCGCREWWNVATLFPVAYPSCPLFFCHSVHSFSDSCVFSFMLWNHRN